MSGPREAGVSFVSALAGIVVVVVLGAIVLSQTIGGNVAPPASPGHPHRPHTTTVPALATVPAAAERAACVADVATIESAVSVYTTLHGAPPPAGVTWATSPGGPLAGQRWPSGGSSFALTWDGSVVVVTPTHGAHAHEAIDGSAGCADL